jgi:hypothetical protein
VLDIKGDSWTRRLRPGDELRFGRRASGVDLGLADDPGLHRHCGTIRVNEQTWELHNTGRWLHILVVSLDRRGTDSLGPGHAMLVPWRVSRVLIDVGSTSHEFVATWRDAHSADPPVRHALGDEDVTVSPVRIDRSSGYFRALVALCEPQLRNPSSDEVATDAQIAWRLNRLDVETRRLSAKTVERRLDHCRTRFGLKETDEVGVSTGLESRDSRRRLVERALLSGAVGPTDLIVLAG